MRGCCLAYCLHTSSAALGELLRVSRLRDNDPTGLGIHRYKEYAGFRKWIPAYLSPWDYSVRYSVKYLTRTRTYLTGGVPSLGPTSESVFSQGITKLIVHFVFHLIAWTLILSIDGPTMLFANVALMPTAVAALLIYSLGWIVYCRYFHPLRSIPGPFIASVSRAWIVFQTMKGNMEHTQRALHKQHGNTV